MGARLRLGACALVLASLAGAGCAHDVRIKSSPPGARVYVDGEDKGQAPVVIEEEAGFFDQRDIRVELEGYQPIETAIVQSEPIWACVIPSVCLAPLTLCTSCFGLRYATRYAEEYEVVLDPIRKGAEPGEPPEDDEDVDPEMTIPY